MSSLAIKPIETFWKGYRFRSRLEARWAVCFDRIGLRWEYEPEGFVLPDQSRYLPDFYLPDQKTYVEIKPTIRVTQQSVYLAGKFNSDWRKSIVPGFSWMSLNEHGFSKPLMIGFHRYIGPYQASFSNGHDFVIPCTHAQYGYEIEDRGEANVFELSSGNEHLADENDVFAHCCAAIHQCDILFAWIDSLDCYGTLAEIGYARALGKKVFLGIDKDLYATLPASGFPDECKPHNTNYHHDLWFVEKMAMRTVVASSALEAYRQTIGPAAQEMKKIQQLQQRWLLIAGNPHPGEYTVFEGLGINPVSQGVLRTPAIRPWVKAEPVARIASGHQEDLLALAGLNAARSARFEHGEAPS